MFPAHDGIIGSSIPQATTLSSWFLRRTRMNKYVLGSTIGEGQFGSVREATVKSTGARVAVKEIRLTRLSEGMPHPVARELLIASRINHPFIVQTIEVLPHGSSMALVMERCKSDLAAVLRSRSVFDPLPISVGGHYFKALLTALEHLHASNILHRDVKPANCFLTEGGILKLGDFGLSRMRGDGMSHEVASRWYRAPELLFGKRDYGGEVDMWSAGCILGELLRGSGDALFAGDGDINQLSKIFDVLGTPTPDTWQGVDDLPDWGKVHFESKSGCGLRGIAPLASNSALDMLTGLLCLDPLRRLTASQALQHQFFRELP